MMTGIYQPSGQLESEPNGSIIPQTITEEETGSSSMKCLDDPNFSFESPRKPNYRVLEDPIEGSSPPPAMPTRRPPAEEVLEGAREKFDKFWGAKNNDN